MARLLITISLLALCLGCGRSESTERTGAQVETNATPPEVAEGSGPRDSAAGESATPLPTESQLEDVLGELTQLTRKFGLEQQRAPKTLDELVAAGYLGRVPEAPAGKKFAIDKKLRVYLAQQ